MFRTVAQLRNGVMQLAGLVAGSSVQTYTEPQIDASIQRSFDMLFRKRYWEWLTDWHTIALGGVNGLPVTNVSTFLKSFMDIEEIWISDTERRVVKPAGREHLRATGSDAQFYTPLMWTDVSVTNRVFKVWPITATGNLDLRCRAKPADFGATSTVPFPPDVLEQAAAWDLLDSDGINPTAAQKAQLLFETTYRDLVANLGDDVIGHGSGRYASEYFTIRTL